MCDSCGDLTRSQARRGVTDVFLPGIDREDYLLAEAIARDRRYTGLEWRAVRLALDCAIGKLYYGDRCTRKDPCRYCLEIGTL